MKQPTSQPELRSPGDNEIITKKELARRLQKTERTIENYQRCGLIPFFKLGRAIYYNWDDVQAEFRRQRFNCGSPGPAGCPPAQPFRQGTSSPAVHRKNNS